MTELDKVFLDRINEYSEEVLADIDPQKTQISVQLEKLKPIMEVIAKEEGKTLQEIFIRYMDLATEASLMRDAEFKENFSDIANSLQ